MRDLNDKPVSVLHRIDPAEPGIWDSTFPEPIDPDDDGTAYGESIEDDGTPGTSA